MTVLIDIRTEGFPEEMEAVMEKITLDSLKYEGFHEECEISISIVDNEEIHQINKQFRGIDRPTDVLSFPQLTFEEGEIMDRNEKGEVVLGDIIISLERAREQAEEYGHSLKREIASSPLTACSIFWAMTIWSRKKKKKCSPNRKRFWNWREFPAHKGKEVFP